MPKNYREEEANRHKAYRNGENVFGVCPSNKVEFVLRSTTLKATCPECRHEMAVTREGPPKKAASKKAASKKAEKDQEPTKDGDAG